MPSNARTSSLSPSLSNLLKSAIEDTRSLYGTSSRPCPKASACSACCAAFIFRTVYLQCSVFLRPNSSQRCRSISYENVRPDQRQRASPHASVVNQGLAAHGVNTAARPNTRQCEDYMPSRAQTESRYSYKPGYTTAILPQTLRCPHLSISCVRIDS